MSQKQAKLFCHNSVKFLLTSIIVGIKDGQYDKIMQDALIFLPHPIYVNALPCETQMLQIVTLHGVYLYQIAHFCIINLSEKATWFNNFVVLNILR